MKREYSFQKAPRCTAISKRTREGCKAPAVRGWTVCRFHGACGGAPEGEANGSYKEGLHKQEPIAERRTPAFLSNDARRQAIRHRRQHFLDPGRQSAICSVEVRALVLGTGRRQPENFGGLQGSRRGEDFGRRREARIQVPSC
jgi:hypothetical protein